MPVTMPVESWNSPVSFLDEEPRGLAELVCLLIDLRLVLLDPEKDRVLLGILNGIE